MGMFTETHEEHLEWEVGDLKRDVETHCRALRWMRNVLGSDDADAEKVRKLRGLFGMKD